VVSKRVQIIEKYRYKGWEFKKKEHRFHRFTQIYEAEFFGENLCRFKASKIMSFKVRARSF